MNKKRPVERSRTIDPNTIVLIRQIMGGVLVFGFIGGFVMGVWYGTRIEWLTISEVIASGGETVSGESVAQRAAATLSGTYLGLVPRRFVWLYPQTDFLVAIKTDPRIQSATVQRSGTTLSITYTEYRPHALWCADLATSTCLYVDDTGYPFAPTPSLRGGSYVRLVSLSGEPAIGETPWSSEEYRKIHELTDRLATMGWLISHVEIDTVRDVFLHIIGGGEFKLTLTLPLEESLQNLETIASSPQFAHLAPGNFQYVDLRFGNKVFVNEEMLATVGETASSTLDAPSQSDGAGGSAPEEE